MTVRFLLAYLFVCFLACHPLIAADGNELVNPFCEVQLGRCGWQGWGAWEATFR